jgi:hypothetical protein
MNYPPDNNEPSQFEPPQQPHAYYPPQQQYNQQWQQPNTYPYYPPQTPPPPAKKSQGGLIFGLIVLFIVVGLCGIAIASGAQSNTSSDAQATTDAQSTMDAQNAQPAQDIQATTDAQSTVDAQSTLDAQPTAQPTFPQSWSYHGNGNQKTSGFAPLSNTWQLSWTCDPASYGFQYNLIVLLYDINGNLIDTPVNVICKDGVTSGSTLEYNASGLFYLSVISEGPWTIKVQTQ